MPRLINFGLLKTGDRDFAEVLRHSINSFVVLGIVTILQFVFDYLLARFFGASGVGLFYLVFSVITVLALVGRLGFDRALVRFIPPLLARQAWGGVRGLRKQTIFLSLVVSVPLAISTILLANTIANTVFNEPQTANYLKVFALALPAFSLFYIYSGLLRGLKLAKESIIIERGILYGLGIIMVSITGLFFDINALFIGMTLSAYATVLVGEWLFIQKVPKLPINYSIPRKTLLLTSMPLLFMVFASYMTGHLNILLLGALSSAENVGIFNVSFKVSMLMLLILTAIDTINAAKISELFYAENKKAEFESIISKTAGLTTILGLPIFITLILFPSYILGIFGEEFRAGATALVILAVAQMVNLGVGSTAYILAMTGFERIQAISVGMVLLLNIALGLLLIPPYGVVGAALAAGTALIARNVVFLVLIRRHLGVWSLPFKAIGIWINSLSK